MSILATDNFNRANASTLGANWTTLSGVYGGSGPEVHSNQAASAITNNLTASYYSAISWPADHYSQATFVALSNSAQGVQVRMATGAYTYYGAGHDINDSGGANTVLRLWKYVAGTYTSLGTGGAGSLASSDIVRCDAQGTTIRALRNGTSTISVTDASIASGNAGLIVFHTVVDVGFFDNWEGGNFITGAIVARQILARGLDRGVSRGLR